MNGCKYTYIFLYLFLLTELAMHPACCITWPHVFRCCGDGHNSHAFTKTRVLQRKLWGEQDWMNLEHFKCEPVLLVHFVGHIHITYSVMKTSEYMKDHMDLNCEERHEDMTDHPSCTHNLKLKPIPVQCSISWGIKPTGRWRHCEFVVYP